MENYSSLDLITIAIEMEDKGNAFYKKAAAKLEDGEARSIFLRLSDEELKHKERFKELQSVAIDEMAGDKSADFFDMEASKYIDDLVHASVFPEDEDIDKVLEGIREPLDAINMALDLEKDSILLYQALSEGTKNRNTRETVLSIIIEERKHISLLNSIKLNYRNI
ncbi:ferritin-like domain-containing protein [Calorimonas adulescens]|jgi:Rubrerythrin.|uniref:Ferritin family protein n=1 Tax=Calorimonas adulescens TaxID=2606906 RepID=A0A5D8QEL8_9THEO|nr:ferritin family protein [Calorimonas adulescens]TZE82952.1 ferritin family protein [Calorimonas adulescens]